jgi:7-cyano-7-deazaguanine synthase
MMAGREKQAIVLLSGGLDSLVALGYSIENGIDVKLALTFDYGQKAAKKELEVSKKICEYYGIKHKIIKLDWLKEITKTSLVSNQEIPTTELNTSKSASSVWVPNRNALFLNIAACFCDSFEYKSIIFGANSDEAETFSDNTEIFRKRVFSLFECSTQVWPEILAPLINYGKNDIVKIAMEYHVPLDLVWSCYDSGRVHCGKCESCLHLKKALIANHCNKYLDILFKNNEN